jgi:SPP1 gp7 family putative phage head morphogenesis protein
MPTLEIGFNVPFNEAIAQAASRGVVLPSIYYGQLQGVARQKAFSIAGITALDQLEAVKKSYEKAVLEGRSFNQWQKEQAVIDLGLPKYRLDNIYRTNLQTSYMAGKWEQFNNPKSKLRYLMYDAINDSRVRPAHLALDGIIREKSDPFWATHSPPCGYRCRCSLIALTDSQAQKRSVNGKGLNQQPILENGQPALPDKDWDYDKTNRMAGVEKAIKDKPQSLLKSELEKRLAEPPKIMTDWKELNLPSAKELHKTIELMQAPEVINIANNELEALDILRTELGVKAGEKRIITTPAGDVLIDDAWLPHIVEKRDAARERFSKWIIPTLENPTEIWLSDYGNDEIRKRYLKLFSASDKQLLVVISILNDSAIWNVVPMPVRSMDNQRNGELLLKNY